MSLDTDNNVTVQTDAGGNTAEVRTTAIGGKQHQHVLIGDPSSGDAQAIATAAKQDIGNSSLSTIVSSLATLIAQAATETTLAAIAAKLPTLSAGRQPVDGSGVTQPISAAALPLPSGASTEATLAALLALIGTEGSNIDGESVKTSGVTSTESYAKVFNGATWDRLRGDITNGLWANIKSSVLPTGAATESTLATLSGNTPAPIALSMAGTESGSPVRQVPAKVVRCSFASVGAGLLTSDLVQVGATGTGMGVSQSAGNLVVTTGMNTNSEFLARSVEYVRGAHAFRASVVLSQRIANNNFSIELADKIGDNLAFVVNSATSVTVTFPTGQNPFSAANVGQAVNLSAIAGAAGVPGKWVIASASGDTVTFTVAGWPASGSGTLTLWGWNYHRVLFDGTSATSAKYDAQRKGWASGDTTITINTTASPGDILHVQSDVTDASMADALRASNTAYQFTTRGSRVENLPDASTQLYLWVRAWNGTTAPASTTTFTVGFVAMEDLENIKVAISGATRNGAGNALPVAVQGTATVSGTVTVTTTTNVPVATFGSATAHRQACVSAISTGAPTSVKAAAGVLNSGKISNNCGAGVWFHIYNKASAPTLGTDTPEESIYVPAGQTVPIDCGPFGERFATGIAYAICDNSAAIPTVGSSIAIAGAANAIVVSLRYT